MLEANKSAVFEKIFAIYNRNLLARRFHCIRVRGLHFLLNKDVNNPLIIYCNHSSWWDGLAAFQISFESRLDSFIMMEEKQLRSLFLFRYLGAFSVNREKPREAYESIDYAARIFREKSDRALWIFPQGEILPNDSRPLKFFRGIAKIVEKIEKCFVASLSIRYEFLGNFKPEIFIQIGEPTFLSAGKDFDSDRLTKNLADNLTRNLDELKLAITNRDYEGFAEL